MIVKGTKQLGSFKRGINIYIPKKQIVIPPAPSGLPVASTNSISLVDPNFSYQNGNYPKIIGYTNFTDDNSITTTNQYGYTFNGAITNGYPLILFNVTTNRWEFGSYQSWGDGGLAWFTDGANTAINSNTNPNYIPTSNWSRNIIINTGIPVASTNQIIVNGEVFAKTYIGFSIYRGELGDEYFGCTSDCGSNSIEDAVYFDGVVWRYDINHLNGGFNNSYSSHIATNPSNNPNFVPTTGWTPSITISSA